MANQITVFLDPAQMPARTQDQATFEALMAAFFVNLPTFGAQFNAGVAAFNAAAAGLAYAIPYTIDLSGTSDIDPGAGKLRFDNATQNLATTLRLDLLGTGNVDYTSMIDTFDSSTSVVKGSIRIVKQGDATKQLLYDVTARSAPGGYRDISVTPKWSTSANPFVNGDAVLLFFQRNGDKGDTGATGPLRNVPYMKVSERQAVTTSGGASSGGLNTRVLNTVETNTITGASLASNQVTLPVGTFRVRFSAPCSMGFSHVATLFNVTDNTVQIVGDAANAWDAGTSFHNTSHSRGGGTFTITAQKVFRIDHYIQVSSGSGLGQSYAGNGSGGTTIPYNVYSQLEIEQVG
jgi:hypothetical protein